MEEQNVTQPMPAEPTPQVVSPPSPPKKSPVVWWVAIVLAVAIAGGAYLLYARLPQPAGETLIVPPDVVMQEERTTPAATPTITVSDSVADIQKDLSGTTIESQNSSEFDADLQSL